MREISSQAIVGAAGREERSMDKQRDINKKRRQLVRYFGFARVGASLEDIARVKQDHRVKVWDQAKEMERRRKLGLED